jgi:hypothetical protein
MAFSAHPLSIARAPRPWLTREKGECAFPVDGESLTLIACCNPCGQALYCPPHAAALRGSRTSSPADFERDVTAFLESRR